ncbi:molybdopterin-dependent oxidoreductase [Nonomuraea gerenzanensis]|uniref:Formate dehydrogenase-O, major subunit n=1 Tax=Nonomuraea gerenzanensis TaxID=93944 RepID=A0A1M4DY59_9ACTN|nr:molybdopterin-dependent oxidoreductase [Nonomuraea gerenzanensis]UBU13833.1 molybdopterin-dependent oxidoreductase [Nonomuraea gerenzanensis]SBO91509.1 Formate dehydrogenase-O, major subunit [Nonomuraea gerenzanensis]
MTSTVHRTCPLCEAVCGLTLTLDDGGHVTGVRGDRDDPFSKGFICPKGASLGRLDEDPDRLRKPLIREGELWREVGWDEAFAAVRAGLGRVADRRSIAVYLGNPNAHTMAGALYAAPLIKALGTRNVFSASTADQMPKHVASGLMFGHPLAIPVPDLDRTDYLLMLGANPLESNGSLCTAPDFPGRLKALRGRGGRLVVVDPRRTRTAALADEHVFVRPGTDAYLLFGIVHTLFAEGLARPEGYELNGLEEVRQAAKQFPPEVVARRTGVPAETIARLARELAAAPTAAVYARIGTCTAEFGTLAQWLVDVLNVLTGNLDRPGGAMFPKPATEFAGRRRPYAVGRWKSRVRGLPEANGELPVATLADEIETPGEGQVTFLLTVAGNPVLSAPHGDRLDAAFRQLDFMVSVDPYLNETTKHADVILPPPRVLQSGHYDFALLGFAVRNYARYSPPLLPLDERPSEAQILARLAMIASGLEGDLDAFVIDEMLRKATQTPGSGIEGRDVAELRDLLEGETGGERRLDLMLRLGPYGEWAGKGDLSLRKLLDNPHGLDLGALEPRLGEVLKTASGLVELAPPQLMEDVERLRGKLEEEPPEIVLIGRRHLRSNNSWMHNVGPLVGGSNRCTLQIHPADVARLGLDGEAVVRSAKGQVTVPVEPTDTIMPGVVSLPHGWGHAGSAQSVAAEHAGVSANTLTDETTIDVPSGNAVFNGVPVTISPTGVIIAH